MIQCGESKNEQNHKTVRWKVPRGCSCLCRFVKLVENSVISAIFSMEYVDLSTNSHHLLSDMYVRE